MKIFVKSLINLQFSLSVGKTFGEVSIKKEDGGFGASLIGRNTNYVVNLYVSSQVNSTKNRQLMSVDNFIFVVHVSVL